MKMDVIQSSLHAAGMIWRMNHRILFLLAITVLCVGCTSTDFQSWEGRNSVVEGHGGTRKVVDGMDVWTFGDPPRRFKVLGISGGETWWPTLRRAVKSQYRPKGPRTGRRRRDLCV